MTDNMIRGDKLHPDDQRSVLNSYLYRNTHENWKQNPGRARMGGGSLPPISDERWFQITGFSVTKSGRLDKRVNHCYTHHTEVPEWKERIDAWAAKKSEHVPRQNPS
jgi:hypothetical protein